MSTEDSLDCVRRAREGDRGAWEELYKRYLPQWLKHFHGRIGLGLRQLYDTQDLVHSALADAIRDIRSLRNEAAFWVWVIAIAERKIAHKRRRLRPDRKVQVPDLDRLEHPDGDPVARIEQTEGALLVLDAMLQLFPLYPQHMSALYLRYFLQQNVGTVASFLGLSERSAQRLIAGGKKLLQSQLPEGNGGSRNPH